MHYLYLCVIYSYIQFKVLRQETDGPRAEQFLPWGQKLHKSRMMEEAGPCPDKRPHIPHCQSQGDLPDYTCTERLPGGQKRGGATP